MSSGEDAAPMMQVECSANRGRSYKVIFDAAGNARRVEVKVWLSGRLEDRRYTWRVLWRHNGDKPMSITAACAVRAALAQRGSV